MEILQRDIGRMEAELSALRAMVNEMRTDVKEIREELSMIRGGYKTLLSVAAAIGAGVAAVGEWLVNKFVH